MQKEKIQAILDKLDLSIAQTTMLEKNELTQNVLNHLSGAGFILESIMEEPRKPEHIPTDSPTSENILEYMENIHSGLSSLAKEIKDLASENESEVVFCCTLMMAYVKLIPAIAIIKYYKDDISEAKNAEKEYYEKLAKTENVIFIINEDMNHKQAKHAIKVIWQDVFEKKKVIFHEDWKPMLSEFMNSNNISYDSVQCEDCLKKYPKENSMFVFIGYRRGIEEKYGLDNEHFTISV